MSELPPMNPYVNISGKPVMKKSVVVFVDILGYSNMIKSINSPEETADCLIRLHEALYESRKEIDPQEDNLLGVLVEKDLYAMSSFTDNIVIGYPIRDDGEAELGGIFLKLSYFQMIMTMKGFFIRGAISIGDIYIDDTLVFGPGLIEAYEAEKDKARDPRIVLAQSAQSAVEKHLDYYGRGSHAPQNHCLLKDSDGQYFIHYLDPLFDDEDPLFSERLVKHKDMIDNKLSSFKSSPKIWSKYFWAANYHNYFCESNNFINKSMKIDTEKLHLMPVKLIN